MANMGNSSHCLTNLPMDVRLKIEGVCQQFEEALQANDAAADIATFLKDHAELPRTHLLRELLAQQIQYLAKTGHEPDLDTFLSSWPDDHPTIKHAFDIATPLLSGSTLADIPARSEVAEGLRYFGEYELLREINRGGMGVVFLARQQSLGRIVAIKMILGGLLASQHEIKRFRTEARATAQLDHPGIVPIYEIGEHDGKQYYSMAYVDGPSLDEMIKNGPLAPPRAARIIQQAAAAVQTAHDRSIVHRDIKPGNILLTASDTPRITDFGLAKILDANSSPTISRQIIGTPGYMSPEQALGSSNITRATDVYGLGATLYAMLTGRAPFAAADTMETLRQINDVPPVSPQLLNPAVPEALATICLKCLEKNPSKRYQSAAELAEALGACLEDRALPATIDQAPSTREKTIIAEIAAPPPPAPPQTAPAPPRPAPPPNRAPVAAANRPPVSSVPSTSLLAKPGIGLAITAAIFLVLGVAVTVAAIVSMFVDDDLWVWLILAAAFIINLVGIFIFYFWLYVTWSAVPQRPDRPSPGAAVGLLFVPFFNFYWVFRAFPGLSLALAEELTQQQPDSRGHSTGFVWGVAAAATCFIPGINLLTPLLLVVWLLLANNAKNRLLLGAGGIARDKPLAIADLPKDRPAARTLRNYLAYAAIAISLVSAVALWRAPSNAAVAGNYLDEAWDAGDAAVYAARDRAEEIHADVHRWPDRKDLVDNDPQVLAAEVYKNKLLDASDASAHRVGPWLIVAYVCLPVSGVLICIWLSSAWRLMNRRPGRVRPVLRLFLPFYNLYWIFRAIPGLSRALRQANPRDDTAKMQGAASEIFAYIVATTCLVACPFYPLLFDNINRYDLIEILYFPAQVLVVLICSAVFSVGSPLLAIWMLIENRQINRQVVCAATSGEPEPHGRKSPPPLERLARGEIDMETYEKLKQDV